MKKIISILAITVALSTQTFATEQEYKDALTFYNTKQYQKAYNIFQKIAKTDASKRIYFYIGRTAYELGNYEEALLAYGKVLEEEPLNLRVRLEIAQTYVRLKMLDKAKNEFSYLLEHNIPKNVRDYIQQLLALIEENKNQSAWNNTLIVGMIYDNNIENTTDISQYNVYIPTLDSLIPIDTNNKKSASSYELGIVSNYIKKLKDDFILDNTLVLYAKNYLSSKYKNKNLQTVSLSIAPTYIQENYKAGIKLSFDHVWYGQTNFLDTYSINPNTTFKLNEQFFSNISLKYSRKAFIQKSNQYGNASANPSDDTERDSNTYELYTDINHYSKSSGLSKVGILWGRDSDLKNIRFDIDKNYYGLTATNNYQLNNKWLLNTAATFTKDNYTNYNTDFLMYRKDTILNLSIGAVYNYSKTISINTAYNYTDQNSNAAPYEYTKDIYKVNLYYRF